MGVLVQIPERAVCETLREGHGQGLENGWIFWRTGVREVSNLILKMFLFLTRCRYVCLCVNLCTRMQGLRRPEEGVWPLEVGVISDYNLPNMGSGDWIQVLCESRTCSKPLNPFLQPQIQCFQISPAPFPAHAWTSMWYEDTQTQARHPSERVVRGHTNTGTLPFRACGMRTYNIGTPSCRDRESREFFSSRIRNTGR